MPQFDVVTVGGHRVRYENLWQHRNLVFVSVGVADRPGLPRYVEDLLAHASDFAEADTALVISTEAVTGLPSPGVIVADRWGEIVYVYSDDRIASMPSPDELLEWVNFVRIQCPECPPY